jgi:hypothetical protein
VKLLNSVRAACETARALVTREAKTARSRPASTKVQSLLFSRSRYTTSSAKKWARSHGYRATKVDVTDNYVRLRQKAPGQFRVLRTVRFGNGIEAVVGR